MVKANDGYATQRVWGRNDRKAERRKRGDLQAEVTVSRSQSLHKSDVCPNGAAKVAIVWHRRETRRQTEKTNSQLRSHGGGAREPVVMHGGAKGGRKVDS